MTTKDRGRTELANKLPSSSARYTWSNKRPLASVFCEPFQETDVTFSFPRCRLQQMHML